MDHLRQTFRIYPTKSQKIIMLEVANSTRFIWNHFLGENNRQHEENGKFIWHANMCKLLVSLKEEKNWLNTTYSQVLQQSAKDLDTAIKRCVKQKVSNFPKFKCKHKSRPSFRYSQHTSLSKDEKYLHLPKIGDIKIKLHRKLPSKYTSVTVFRDAIGWYASFVVSSETKPLTDQVQKIIGIDLNSEHTALSNGEFLPNLRPMKKFRKKIKQLSQQLARKRKGSKNREKTRRKLAKQHKIIANQRKNDLHQISNLITKDHDLVCAETLNVAQMKSNHLAAKAIADVSWGTLIRNIEYKCELRGKHFIQINQWLPSSKKCSECGFVKKAIPLTNREYNCEECHVSLHRDTNAAVNIENWGYQQWSAISNNKSGQELPKVPVDVVFDILVHSDIINQSQSKQEASVLI